MADPALARGEFLAELGRYWTTHVKTSIAVANAGHQVLDWLSFPTGGYRTTITSAQRPLVLSVTASYQFRENVFAHPYVSAGVRLAWLWDQSETYGYFPPNTYVLISSETSAVRVDARPVIGGGLKAYFANGRAFVRPEAIVAFNPHGSTRVLTRVLVGADF